MTETGDEPAEKAPIGLHEFCETLVQKYIDKSSKILDIASGSGAMAQRLKSRGYAEIYANDIDRPSYRANDIPVSSVDLNTRYSAEFDNNFDAVLAIEIIEHLENPLQFLRECRNLLKDDGILLVTTPNVLCSESLLLWLRKGNLLFFSKADYYELGHISIMPKWLVDAHLDECGFSLVYSGFTPRLLKPKVLNIRGLLRYVALAVTDLLLVCLRQGKAEAVGTNYVVVARKSMTA